MRDDGGGRRENIGGIREVGLWRSNEGEEMREGDVGGGM